MIPSFQDEILSTLPFLPL